MRTQFLIAGAFAVSLGLALPSLARNHGTTPGLEGSAHANAIAFHQVQSGPQQPHLGTCRANR